MAKLDLSRLDQIRKILEDAAPGTISARAIAEALGVSPRTVRRDLPKLEAHFGARIERTSRGYKLAEDCLPTPGGYENGDLAAFCAAKIAMMPFEDTPFARKLDRAIDRLGEERGPLVHRQAEHLRDYFTFTLLGTPKPHLGRADELIRLAMAQHSIEIDYRTRDEPAARTRIVDPYGVANRAGDWYLVAFDHRREAFRIFHFARIEAVRPLEAQHASDTTTHFERDPSFVLDAFFRSSFGVRKDGRRQTVHIRFRPRVADWLLAREHHPDEVVEQHDDGTIDWRVDVEGAEEMLHFVLRFGADAEVIEPRRLRDRVAEEAVKLAKRYDQRIVAPSSPALDRPGRASETARSARRRRRGDGDTG